MVEIAGHGTIQRAASVRPVFNCNLSNKIFVRIHLLTLLFDKNQTVMEITRG